MKRSNSANIALLTLLALGCAQGTPEPTVDGPTTYRPQGTDRLTAPSKAAPEAIVRDFLRSRGLPAGAATGLGVTRTRRVARTGITHVRLEQTAGGLRVHGAYVKAALDDDGALVHVIDAAARATGTARPAAIDARGALRVVLSTHELRTPREPAELRRAGNVVAFARGGLFYSDPTVERVAVVGADGQLDEAFLVETWTTVGNLLRETLVGGGGAVLDDVLRTSEDRYNVFPVDPRKTPQVMIDGPGSWLFAGDHTSQRIAGNNVQAYVDADANGLPDEGGATVSDGVFAAALSSLSSPDVDVNKDVAVQNLFYLNNRIHDTLLAAGFDEAAGNFQQDNFDHGGAGGDPVNAEAQDGSGMNNTNFSTPADGRRPRMQMYLWSALGDNQVVVDAPAAAAATYRAQGGQFAPSLTVAGLAGDVVVVNDGQNGDGTGTPSDGCEALAGLEGKLAIVDRGLCPFVQKVKNAQTAGAIGVIIANNQGGDAILVMGGTDATITIPATFISQNDGAKLKAATGLHATLRLTDPPPAALDGDLDSDIVWHEYGHGLTWRMIGNMSGSMSGAIGEGMSDVLSILMNQDDVVGEYAAGDPRGIRSAPYGTLVRTYSDFKAREVHHDGEMYGAIGWKMFQLFTAAGVPKLQLLAYLVDGMNYTREQPAFEDMRDGILQAVASTPHECLVWRAFAAYGVGVGARGVVRGPRIYVKDSKELPKQCR